MARTTVSVCGLSLGLTLQAALPTPLVDMRFSEGSGVTAANGGSLGGSASLLQMDEYPLFTNNVPTGVFAPAGNASALDFGAIAAGQGGRAADLTAAQGDGTLGALNAFTVCGWLNARDLNEGWGGNRIAFALASPNGPGFDLVQLASGALRIGINQWPDGGGGGGPLSSAGVLKADPQTGAANWVFFTVTYDPSLTTGNLKYFFGSPTALAALDTAHNYTGGLDNGGLIESSGMLTLGNFGDVVGARNETGPGGGSRVFRGLMDEVRVYDRALDLAEVQQAQLNGALPPVPVTITKQPLGRTVFAGQPATFSVQANGSAPFTYQWQRGTANIDGATESSYTLAQTSLADDGATFRVKVSNAATPAGLFSEPASLTVLAETGHKVFLSFSEGGTAVTNLGNLAGQGVFAVRDGYPAASTKVPAGAFAPTDNLSALDFGGIAAGQGGRAVDLTNRIDNTLGPMTAFTVTGWLNCSDLTEGGGGNRLAFALATPGGPGFDLVQLASGALRLGVNQWPDGGGGGPLSSEGKITADPATGAANWVFFAVTYDSTLSSGNVTYYFGTPGQAAEADVSLDYLQGAIERTGPLTIGNFSTVVGARNDTGPGGGSRCFRGLMDELNVFNKALSLSEIQAVQKAPAYKPAVVDPVVIPAGEPADRTVFAGSPTTFRVNAAGTPPLAYQWWKNDGGAEAAITGATNASYALAATSSGDNGDQFWVVVSNAKNSESSRKATLTVKEENNLKLSFSFSEAAGTSTANLGNLGGSAVFAQQAGLPAFTNVVPTGAFAPGNNESSLHFGTIAAGDGGRAANLAGGFYGSQVGPMSAFTLAGWLNCQDSQEGPGGNRIVCAHNFNNDPGFDLVQIADGSLRIGVNSWPDWPAATVGPFSTAGMITVDPEAGNGNWVFFAVTYDSADPSGEHIKYYFGSPSQEAALDVAAAYDRGGFASSGAFTIGNLNTADGARNATGGGSRVFRGLMDEINVFNKALTLAEIRALQKAPAKVPVTEVPLTAAREGNQVAISWESSANFQLQYRLEVGQGSWTDEATAPTVNGNQKTVRLPATGQARFYRLISR